LAHDLFGVLLPDPVLRDALGDQHVQSLAKHVCRQFTVNAEPNPRPNAGMWSRALFRIRSRDNFWQGLRHTLRLGMSPTESDRKTLRLPAFLAPLYVIVRPWRLLREYGLGSKRPPNNQP
jgi:hypothetical protein